MIKLVIPSIPPSSNNAYFSKGKMRVLTKEGRKYKNETVAHLATHYRQELMIFKPNHRYQFHFQFFVENVQNKLWKPGGKVNRYKKFDGANLTKLLEDCLADAGGYDDSQTFTSTWQKKQAAPDQPEQTRVWAWDLEEEHDPFDFDFMLERL